MQTSIPQRIPDRNSQTSYPGSCFENAYIAPRITSVNQKHHLGKSPCHAGIHVRPSDFDRSEGSHEYTYSYDYENRLIGVVTGTSVIEYSYDHDGVRVQKVVDGVVTNYVVDKNRQHEQVLEERDTNNDLIVSYVYGLDLISQNRDGEAYYVHTAGHNGSTLLVTDSSQASVANYEYEPYGDVAWSSGAGTEDNAYRFTGEQYDAETGMYYLRARYYEPGVGRFVTRDSWAGNAQRSLSLNKYLYTEGNPIVFVDPSGHMVAATMAVSAGINILSSVASSTFRSFVDTIKGKLCSIVGCSSGDEERNSLVVVLADNPAHNNRDMGLTDWSYVSSIPTISRKISNWDVNLLEEATGPSVTNHFNSTKYKGEVAVVVYSHGLTTGLAFLPGDFWAEDYVGNRWDVAASLNLIQTEKSVKGVFLNICFSDASVGEIGVTGHVKRFDHELSQNESRYSLRSWLIHLDMD